MDWLILLAAGLMEVGWAICLGYTDGFKKFWPSALTTVLLIGSVYLLNLAMRTIPLGTAYAVWTGIGVIGTVLMGILILEEKVNPVRLIFVAIVMLGIIGLKFTSEAKA
jgi:quaternary ammonium compound-resistance protein SugE